MIVRNRRVWIGIGTATLAGAVVATGAAAQETKHPEHGGHAAKSEPGAPNPLAAPQAGEAYLTDGGPKDTRIRIYRDIALMRGHLRVGDELIRQDRWDDAIVHFLHPAEELYGAMERYIKLHGVTPFDRELKAQAEAVKAKRMGAYEQNAKIVQQRLAAALEKFKTFMTPPLRSFTVRSANEVLKVASLEYEAAIEDGRISNPMEYQDSRGFVWTAEELYQEVGQELEKIDGAKLQEIRSHLEKMKTAFPTAMPPNEPAMTAEEFADHATKIEELSSVYW